MKGFRILAILVVCFIALSAAQKKKDRDSSEEKENNLPESPSRSTGGGRDGGRCSCSDLENQLDSMDLRLDRMVQTWNDFVDKNRNMNDGPLPIRRPPGYGGPGGRPGSHYPPARSSAPRYFGGRSGMDEDDRQGTQGSSRPRFRF